MAAQCRIYFNLFCCAEISRKIKASATAQEAPRRWRRREQRKGGKTCSARSSDPLRSEVYFSDAVSILTRALPDFAKPSSSAARRDSSITAGFFCPMRSVTVTTTLLPFSTLLTLTLVPKAYFLWDAVSLFLS